MIHTFAHFRRLRYNQIEKQHRYHADISSMSTRDYTVIIPLKNEINNSLNLEITLLDTASARIQISEPNNTRFGLTHYGMVKDLGGVP